MLHFLLLSLLLLLRTFWFTSVIKLITTKERGKRDELGWEGGGLRQLTNEPGEICLASSQKAPGLCGH